jgi:hypothetical protein
VSAPYFKVVGGSIAIVLISVLKLCLSVVLREEVRPIKSEIAIYDFAKYDFAKYVCSQCKTHQNQTYLAKSHFITRTKNRIRYILIPIDASKYSQTHYK